MPCLTATEAARSFSDLLNRVAEGEEVEIVRGGAPVAVIGPPKARLLSADRFRELLASAPPVDEEFADDVRAVRREIGPPEDAWQS
jgi:antitoxin (DNA-binding transcriptional repressor) of toxin-antitoxin stability system